MVLGQQENVPGCRGEPYGVGCGGWEGLRGKEGKSRGEARQRGLRRRRKATGTSQRQGDLCSFWMAGREEQQSGPWERRGTANLYKCPLCASFQVSEKTHTLPPLCEPSFWPRFPAYQLKVPSLLWTEEEKEDKQVGEHWP